MFIQINIEIVNPSESMGEIEAVAWYCVAAVNEQIDAIEPESFNVVDVNYVITPCV